jgi:hypothetical protein
VEFACTRPGSAKPKTIYSWALYSSRKARAGAQAGRSAFGSGRSGFGSGRSGFGSARSGFGSTRSGFGAAQSGFGSGYQGMSGGVSGRAPADAVELARQQPSQLMVTELSRRAAQARDGSLAEGALRSTTSWLPVAAMLVPVVLLLVAFMVR